MLVRGMRGVSQAEVTSESPMRVAVEKLGEHNWIQVGYLSSEDKLRYRYRCLYCMETRVNGFPSGPSVKGCRIKEEA